MNSADVKSCVKSGFRIKTRGSEKSCLRLCAAIQYYETSEFGAHVQRNFPSIKYSEFCIKSIKNRAKHSNAA